MNSNNKTARRASIFLGFFMAFVLVAGAIIPLFTGNQTQTLPQENTPPTQAPIPTFPPPPTDFSAIRFDRAYLHPTGIFAIALPEGWNASEPNKGASIAQVNLINNTTSTVVDTYVQDAGTITPDQLSTHFSPEAIGASWARFERWTETSRAFDAETGRLRIDFNVTSNRQQFVARQEAWTDGRWIYVVRVLAPANATQFLLFLLDQFVASFEPLTQFEGTPLDWTAYYDTASSHIIRFPTGWSLTDSAPGAPASITSSEGVQLRVQAVADTTVADEAAAIAFVEGLRPGVQVTSTAPTTRGGLNGFSVAYSFATIDGEPQSGYAVLLNGADGTLHVADLRVPEGNVDLNAVMAMNAQPAAEATPEAVAPIAPVGLLQVPPDERLGVYNALLQVMSTFQVIPPLALG
jgi:hypothetical protein